MSASGMAMMFKAMGFDPEQLIAKGKELEAQGKAIAAEVQVKVASIDERMSNMEAMMVILHDLIVKQMASTNRLEGAIAGTRPAGESSEAELVETVPSVSAAITKNGKRHR